MYIVDKAFAWASLWIMDGCPFSGTILTMGDAIQDNYIGKIIVNSTSKWLCYLPFQFHMQFTFHNYNFTNVFIFNIINNKIFLQLLQWLGNSFTNNCFIIVVGCIEHMVSKILFDAI